MFLEKQNVLKSSARLSAGKLSGSRTGCAFSRFVVLKPEWWQHPNNTLLKWQPGGWGGGLSVSSKLFLIQENRSGLPLGSICMLWPDHLRASGHMTDSCEFRLWCGLRSRTAMLQWTSPWTQFSLQARSPTAEAGGAEVPPARPGH